MVAFFDFFEFRGQIGHFAFVLLLYLANDVFELGQGTSFARNFLF